MSKIYTTVDSTNRLMKWLSSTPSDQQSHYADTDKSVEFIFDSNSNALSSVIIDDIEYKIGKMLGKSRAVVFNVDSVNYSYVDDTPLCIKIAKHGNIKLNEMKLKYIREHADEFTGVFDYVSDVTFNKYLILNGVNLTNHVDICVLEKVDMTLQDLCEKLRRREHFGIRCFSVSFLSYLTIKLIIIANNLILNHLCYTDIKAANIGIIIRDNKMIVKLIDVDTIDSFAALSTWHTSGKTSPKMNIKRIQYLNIFFTLFSLLFLDNTTQMCSSNYKHYYNGKLYNYMTWFDDNYDKYSSWFDKGMNRCAEYKYALLVGTYKIIADSFDNPHFNLQDIVVHYNDIVMNVRKVIIHGYNIDESHANYFTLIAQYLVIMVALFIGPPEHVMYIANNLLQLPPNIIATRSQSPSQPELYTNVQEISQSVISTTVMLDPEVSLGVSIVNILRKYAVGFCVDETCSALKEYGEYFLNIDE